MNITSKEIIDFWYSDRLRNMWFASTPQLDKEILDKYGALCQTALSGDLDDWAVSPEGSLALAIVLDQFPLNMFRGQAQAFASERKAVQIALDAIDKGYDKQIGKDKIVFLYMPLMHSEILSEQDLSVKLFRATNLNATIRFAEHHREIIKQFGRFPHRNKILGRESTTEEIKYLTSPNAFKG